MAAAICAAVTAANAQEKNGFLKDGDLWAFMGDSITNADTYRRAVERAARHYYPQASLRFVQAGKSGTLASASKQQFESLPADQRPTIISLMTGMNNSINSPWRKGMPMEGPLADYRKSITDFAKAAKANGITVLLMSPTLTDESLGWCSVWELGGTAEFLRKCGQIVKEVAAAEDVLYVPVAEEFEARQQSLATQQVLRPDGVHPSSLGEYQIARSLISRLGLGGKLAGERKLGEPASELPVDVSLTSRFLDEDGDTIQLLIKSSVPMTVTATVSLGDYHETQKWPLSGSDKLNLKLPKNVLHLETGKATDLVLELVEGKQRSLYIIDLCKVRVLHLKDGKASGVIDGPADRSQGPRVANWSLAVDGNTLTLEAEIFDSEIRSDSAWAWGRSGATVWLDYRGGDRFADINVDSDVHQTVLNVYDKPFFTGVLRPWLGRGMGNAALLKTAKTDTGYKLQMCVSDKFSKHNDSDLAKRDFIGFDMIAVAMNTVNGKKTGAFYPLFPTQYPHDQYANTLMIVDLKNKLKGEQVVNVCLSRL